MEITLTNNEICIIDDEDFLKIKNYNWYASKCKNITYATGYNKKDKQYMHRLIMNASKSEIIDHINNNGLDNRKQNLRICTVSQNAQNNRKRRDTSSIYKGVCYNKRNSKWMASLKINGKFKYLGEFKEEIDAAKAYNNKAIELFGEFANLNNI
jgi:hypothetical protein